jgi:hypothetical protein
MNSNIDDKVKKFTNNYYSTIENNSYSDTSIYFKDDCKIVFNKNTFNIFDYYIHLIKNKVINAKYDIEQYHWISLNNNCILVVVSGYVVFIGDNDIKSDKKCFSDTFVIDITNDKIINLISILQ